MDGLWNRNEKEIVESRLRVAIIGGPETVRRKLTEFLSATAADEIIITSDLYSQSARLASFEIAAAVMKDITPADPDSSQAESGPKDPSYAA